MTLLSPWAKHIDFDDPLSEYPRMQLQRGSFTSLNGIWEFKITGATLWFPLRLAQNCREPTGT